MPIRSGGQAPYAPPQTIRAFIQAFRNRPVQTPVTQDVLVRTGVTESLAPRVLSSLRLLEFIDDDANPTPQLEALRRAPQGEYQARLAEIVRSVYGEVFQYFDPSTDGEDKARDIFRHYEPIGQLTRIVRLFLGLCEEAGIIPEQPKKPSQTSSSVRAAQRKERKPEVRRTATVGPGARVRTDAGATVPPAIMGVLNGLPAPERGWTRVERDHFYAAFGALLDFSIPIRDPGATMSEDDAGDDDTA